MKNNLVKILATLGLIIAIAVILKSVFGVGKIGFNKLTNSKNIIFDKCWSAQKTDYQGKTSVDYKNRKDSQSGRWENQKFEIDLKNSLIIYTVTYTDAQVKKKKKLSIPSSKIDQEKFQIQTITDKYIRSVPKEHRKTAIGLQLPGRKIFVFKLDTKTIKKITEHPDFPQTNFYKCDEILGL